MAPMLDVAPDLPAFFSSAPTSRISFPVPPSGTDTIPVAFDTSYSWAYSVQRQDLRNLYEKSKDAILNARTYLAWDTDVDPEAENTPDAMIPIFGSHLWDRLDKKTEVPKLRRLA